MTYISPFTNFQPDYLVHPGITLKETIETVGMSQTELAKRTGRPEKTISEIINGAAAITPETAIQFERVLGVSASFWNNLEKNFQELKARNAVKDTLEKEIEAAKRFPYNLMAKLGWVKKVKSINEKIEELLSFFSVNSLYLIDDVMAVNFRQHTQREISKEAILCWLRQGEIDAKKINIQDYDEAKVKQLISKISSYTLEDPSVFGPKLQKELADCGIALIFTPGLPKTYICGAARWITPKKALIQLSLRGRYADIMWFTLYHELAHILLHSKKERFLDLEFSNKDALENEADIFASNSLISKDSFKKFMIMDNFSSNAIIRFSKSINIHPGILVGKLQHDGIIPPSWHNSLRVRYLLKKEN